MTRDHDMPIAESGWKALRMDPLPWLLDGPANFRWRLLIDVMGRAAASPAVVRDRSAANTAPELAPLLVELEQSTQQEGALQSAFRVYSGVAWKLIAAVQLGADPSDERLQATAKAIVDSTETDGGFGADQPLACTTARFVQALTALGWERDLRVQEALAWLEDETSIAAAAGWTCPIKRHHGPGKECLVAAAAVLGMGAAARRRPGLAERAHASAVSCLQNPPPRLTALGHPNLGRTDLAELFGVMARHGCDWDQELFSALRSLQEAQDSRARWRRTVPVPSTLDVAIPFPTAPSRWITLQAMGAVLRYAEVASLPRLFPQKPDHLRG